MTGKGHCTPQAIIMGLIGYEPETLDPNIMDDIVSKAEQTGTLSLGGSSHEVNYSINMISENLPLHENGMQLHAFIGQECVFSKTYYSIGGGFIIDADEFAQPTLQEVDVPYPFRSASELIAKCDELGFSISALVMKNEKTFHSEEEIYSYFRRVWNVMEDSIQRGLKTEGNLPGPMRIPRRAPSLHRHLTSNVHIAKDPMNAMDWVNLFAIAMSEENAAGGRIITAPTNGACGIVPAVLSYYNRYIQPLTDDSLVRFFLASGAIGYLYKINASISGAEVGCQGEVGVACSMAAAGLAELMGSNAEQVCIAAEIAMEHNLGLTCDPVGGQVQIPCIERNAIASVKAINAARMALLRTSKPQICLDKVIAAMYETGKDLNPKYRETSCGGLALQVKLAKVAYNKEINTNSL